MNSIIGEKFLTMLEDPLFPRVETTLRRGAHIGEEDLTEHAFVREHEDYLSYFFQRYEALLAATPEGSYYLNLIENNLFQMRTLSRMDMVVGKTLAGMMLEPDIVSSFGKVDLGKLTSTLEINPGRTALLAIAGIRSGDSEQGNKKYREALSKSLNTLQGLNFLRWSPREEQIVPFKAVMRFADDVRTEDEPEDNLAALVASGAVTYEQAGVTTLDESEAGDNEEE